MDKTKRTMVFASSVATVEIQKREPAILERTNWTKLKCQKTHYSGTSGENGWICFSEGKEYFCQMGKHGLPKVISDSGIVVNFSDQDFVETFGVYIRKEDL